MKNPFAWARNALARRLLGISAEEIRYTFEDVRSELRATRAELKAELEDVRAQLARSSRGGEDKPKGMEIPVAEA